MPSSGGPEAGAEAGQPPAPMPQSRGSQCQWPSGCGKNRGWEEPGKATCLGEEAPSRARRVKDSDSCPSLPDLAHLERGLQR